MLIWDWFQHALVLGRSSLIWRYLRPDMLTKLTTEPWIVGKISFNFIIHEFPIHSGLLETCWTRSIELLMSDNQTEVFEHDLAEIERTCSRSQVSGDQTCKVWVWQDLAWQTICCANRSRSKWNPQHLLLIRTARYAPNGGKRNSTKMRQRLARREEEAEAESGEATTRRTRTHLGIVGIA